MSIEKDTSNYYIDKKEFLEELIQYNKTKVISEKLHLMFWNLAKNIAKKSRFRGYTYKQDMIQEGYIRCVTYVGSFDITKSNPYSYYTQVIHNKFQDFIWDEQDQEVIKWKLLKNKSINKPHDDNYSELNLSPSLKEKVNTIEYSHKRKDKKPKVEVSE